MSRFQNSKTRHFDTHPFCYPLGAAKETPKRAPKQMGTKMPSKFSKLKKLAILKTIHFVTPLDFAETQDLARMQVSWAIGYYPESYVTSLPRVPK